MTLQRTLTKRHIGHVTNRSAEREWTAVEKFRLKGLAKQAHSAEKIARALRRPVGATIDMASRLGVALDVIGQSTKMNRPAFENWNLSIADVDLIGMGGVPG